MRTSVSIYCVDEFVNTRRKAGVALDSQNVFPSENVGATLGRPPKNFVFRVFQRKITVFFALQRWILLSKIRGRPRVAPTHLF